MKLALALLFLAGDPPVHLGGAVDAEPKPPACVAYAGTGTAFVEAPDLARREARVPEWLTPGTRVSMSTSGRLLLVFFGGARYELGPDASASVTERGLEKMAGPIRQLPALPVLPRPEGLASLAGTPAGAVRVRAGEPLVVSPAAGERVPADEAIISFGPSAGARATIHIEDEAGHELLQVETRSTRLEVPAGVLRPGQRYYVRVRAFGAGGDVHSGESAFETLTAESEKARRALRSAVVALAEPETAALLAAIDRSLGVPSARPVP
jgi:hypothetical protein